MFDANETLPAPEDLEPEVNQLIARLFGFGRGKNLSSETLEELIEIVDLTARNWGGLRKLQRSLFEHLGFLREVILELRELSEVRPGLFISGSFWCAYPDVLKAKGFTHIVDCAGNGHLEDEGFHYLRLDLADDSEQDLTAARSLANRFVREAMADGGQVLVHCEAGITRSAAIVASYLMEAEDLGACEALREVCRSRGIIDPNEGFVAQLQATGGSSTSREGERPRPWKQEIF